MHRIDKNRRRSLEELLAVLLSSASLSKSILSLAFVVGLPFCNFCAISGARAAIVFSEDFDSLTLGTLDPFPGAEGQGGWFRESHPASSTGEIQGTFGNSGNSLRQLADIGSPSGAQTIDRYHLTEAYAVENQSVMVLRFDYLSTTSDQNLNNPYVASFGIDIMGIGIGAGNGPTKAQTKTFLSLASFNGTDNNVVYGPAVGASLDWDTWHTVELAVDLDAETYRYIEVNGQREDLSAIPLRRHFIDGQWVKLTSISNITPEILPARFNIDGTVIESSDSIYWDNLRIIAFNAGVNEWSRSSGGDFHTPSHWSEGMVPGPTDPALFNLASDGYTVTAAADIATGSLDIKNDNVVLELGENEWVLPGSNALTLKIAETAGEDASLTLNSGTLVAGRTHVANLGSTGELVIDGPTAELSVVDSAVLMAGDSSLAIRNGGRLTVAGVDPNAETTLYVATHAGSTANVEVIGPNSVLEVGSMLVGERGTGQLDVMAGGSVAITALTFRIGGREGASPVANGTVTVSGAGSQITSFQQVQVGDSNATGTLIVQDGGSLHSGFGSSPSGTSGIIGWRGSASNGLVTINAYGSEWIQDGILRVGWEGNGEVQVEDSGRIESARGQLSPIVPGVGTVNVADAGSIWAVEQDLTVGGTETAQGGQGLLEVSSGGLVEVGTTLRVWESGVVDATNGGTIEVGVPITPVPAGTINIGGGGTLYGSGTVKGNVRVERGPILEEGTIYDYVGVVAPGNGSGSVGLLTVDGNYTVLQNLTELAIDLAGTQPSLQYDQLHITGHATLGGTLRVSLANAFVPSLGNSFDILDWGTSSGAFSTVSLPALGTGLAWNTSQLYTNGVLSVAPTHQIIAQWTFEAGKPGSPVSAGGTTLSGVSPATGSGTASGFHTSAATVWDNPAGNGSTESMSSNNWAIGDYYQFQVSTIDLEDIRLEFHQVGSSSGPRDFQLQYSTDGTLFTDFAAPYMLRTNATPAWSVSTPSGLDFFSFDLSSIAAIEDQASLFFRLAVASNISTSGGAISTGGTSRLDNVTIWGTQILGIAGDFDSDGDVDGRDFLLWQRNPSVGNLADWQNNYGTESLSAVTAVPEPAGLYLLAALLSCALLWQHRRARRSTDFLK